MKQQKSFEKEGEEAALYLVPTPIGNLEDMSFRAVRILKEADIIAAEDTRNTKKLCNYFEIATSVISYHEHNKETSGQKLLNRLEEGQVIALVSDAGMPTISDPSGLVPQPFYFYGFLQRQQKEKKRELERLKQMEATWIIYESPHRLKETLKHMLEVLGNRNIVLCRELTKKYEEFIRGTISEAAEWARENEVRGEFCLIVEGASEEDIVQDMSWWADLTVNEHVEHYIGKDGLSVKEAIKQTSKDRNMQKREVYQSYHIDE